MAFPYPTKSLHHGLESLPPTTIIISLTTLALAISIPLLVMLHTKRQAKQKNMASRFANLPPELRNAVYEYLTVPESPSYKFTPVKADWYTRLILLAAWLFRLSPVNLAYLIPVPMRPKPTRELLNTMCLVSRQFRDEYMYVFCRCATFHFTLDASITPSERPFKIAPETLSRIRKCALRILATPGIVGAFDPREATGDWLLRDKVFEAMEDMKSLTDMTLSIQACGNQLWNPLWLWHFTSQAFKESKVQAFRRIDFTLEGWTLREPNHMARRADGNWEWQCAEGHCVQEDREGQMPVRQFCGALYAECRICDPGDHEKTEESGLL